MWSDWRHSFSPLLSVSKVGSNHEDGGLPESDLRNPLIPSTDQLADSNLIFMEFPVGLFKRLSVIYSVPTHHIAITVNIESATNESNNVMTCSAPKCPSVRNPNFIPFVWKRSVQFFSRNDGHRHSL